MNVPPTLAEEIYDWILENRIELISRWLPAQARPPLVSKAQLIESIHEVLANSLEDLQPS